MKEEIIDGQKENLKFIEQSRLADICIEKISSYQFPGFVNILNKVWPDTSSAQYTYFLNNRRKIAKNLFDEVYSFKHNLLSDIQLEKDLLECGFDTSELDLKTFEHPFVIKDFKRTTFLEAEFRTDYPVLDKNQEPAFCELIRDLSVIINTNENKDLIEKAQAIRSDATRGNFVDQIFRRCATAIIRIALKAFPKDFINKLNKGAYDHSCVYLKCGIEIGSGKAKKNNDSEESTNSVNDADKQEIQTVKSTCMASLLHYGSDKNVIEENQEKGFCRLLDCINIGITDKVGAEISAYKIILCNTIYGKYIGNKGLQDFIADINRIDKIGSFERMILDNAKRNLYLHHNIVYKQ